MSTVHVQKGKGKDSVAKKHANAGVFSLFPDTASTFFSESFEHSASDEQFIPNIDIRRSNNALIVRADLPGMGKDDVQVEVMHDSLVISGARSESSEHKEGEKCYSECIYGSFYRAIPLPEGADVEQAHASFKRGVLEVSLPIAGDREESRRLPIESDVH